MKYKNKVAKLLARQRWFDSLPESKKSGMKRLGSVKVK